MQKAGKMLDHQNHNQADNQTLTKQLKFRHRYYSLKSTVSLEGG
jgi:hypothetical protein